MQAIKNWIEEFNAAEEAEVAEVPEATEATEAATMTPPTYIIKHQGQIKVKIKVCAWGVIHIYWNKFCKGAPCLAETFVFMNQTSKWTVDLVIVRQLPSNE